MTTSTPTPGANNTITIDDQTYAIDSLSQEAKSQVVHLRFCDHEIERLQMQLAVAQTARLSYAAGLKAALAKA